MSKNFRHVVANDVLSGGIGSALAAFVRTAQLGSFARAAEAMGLTPSGVAKSVSRLETRLGTKLFSRTTRSLSLTETGSLLLEHAERIVEALASAEAALTEVGSRPRGRLKVSLAPGIGRALVLPTLKAFMDAYPEISLDVEFDSRLVDVVAGGYDVVLRTGTPGDSSLRGRRLGSDRSLLCAAPSYLERWGRPETVLDLVRHRCIRYRFPTTGRIQPWPITLPRSVGEVPIPTSLAFNDPEAIRLSAIGGFGIALIAEYAAQPAIESGSLVSVLESAVTNNHSGEIWLLWPSDRHHLPKVRAFVDHVAASFAKSATDDYAINMGGVLRQVAD